MSVLHLFKENYVLEKSVWVLVIFGRAQVFDNLCVLVLLARGALSISTYKRTTYQMKHWIACPGLLRPYVLPSLAKNRHQQFKNGDHDQAHRSYQQWLGNSGGKHCIVIQTVCNIRSMAQDMLELMT